MASPSLRQIAEVVLGMMQPPDASKLVPEQIAAYLLAEQRTRDLTAIMREVSRLRYEQEGIIEVTATSAHALPHGIEDSVKEIFKAKAAVIDSEIDKSVIGGVRLSAGDRQIDMTVARQLQDFKQSLSV